MRGLLGENDVLAYLVMMTARLVELHRVLKPTGSLYLHCDPTASHYLKVMLDTIFGGENFRIEIIWQRTGAKGLATTRLPTNHDVLLAHGKTDVATWNDSAVFTPYDENALDDKTSSKYRHRDSDGRLYRLDNLINPNHDRPNLTYEFMGVTKVWRWTRERMEQAAAYGLIYQSKPGMVPRLKRYLDEQRGARSATDAAQKLGRRWVGIDITYLSIDLIDKRLRHSFGEAVAETYEIVGIPRDIGGARALFKRNPFEFERWAVSMVDGQPNEKQVGDRGIDGVIRYPLDGKGNTGRILVSVKGGGQIVTVEELLSGKRPYLPPILLPYIQAQRHTVDPDQLTLGV